MIGNDIVDLELARKESNWQRIGFLNKIFTQKEQLFILNSEKPEIMIWNLWTRKEAAYKIYNRQTKIRGYFPLQIECFNIHFTKGFYYGKVVIKEQQYFTKTKITRQYINSIATVNEMDLDSILILKASTKIQKTGGLPYYLDPNELVLKPVSISHHGRFEQKIVL